MRRFALLCVLAVAACGDDPKKGGPDLGDDDTTDQDLGPGAVTLAIEPATVSIAEGATGTVHFDVTRTGQAAEGEVAYSVSGVPNGIRSTITGDDLELQVPFFAQNRSTTISVTATADNGRKNTASFTLNVTAAVPVDVRGSVIAYDTGLPIENLQGLVQVALWGRNATTPVTITPTDASFAFDNVTPPYDVMVTYNVTPLTRHLYLGLGIGNPKLTYFGNSTLRVSQATHGFTVGASGYDNLAYDVSCANNASSAASIPGTTDAEPKGPVSATPTSCTVTQFAFELGASFPEAYSNAQASTSTVNLTDGAVDDLRFTPSAANNHVLPIVYTPAADVDPYIDHVWVLGGQRSLSYFAAPLSDPITDVVVPNDPAIVSGVCLSASRVELSYSPLNAGGSTTCRLTPPTTATSDFGALTKATLPGAPINDTARGNIAFPSLGGFGAYIIGKVSPPEEATFVFSNGPINAQTMARHGLAFDTQPTQYDWRSFKLNGMSSIDVFAGADVTQHGFLTRQSGYSISDKSNFRVVD